MAKFQWIPRTIQDGLSLAAGLCVVGGCWMAWPPLGVIALGLFLGALSQLGD